MPTIELPSVHVTGDLTVDGTTDPDHGFRPLSGFTNPIFQKSDIAVDNTWTSHDLSAKMPTGVSDVQIMARLNPAVNYPYAWLAGEWGGSPSWSFLVRGLTAGKSSDVFCTFHVVDDQKLMYYTKAADWTTFSLYARLYLPD